MKDEFNLGVHIEVDFPGKPYIGRFSHLSNSQFLFSTSIICGSL